MTQEEKAKAYDKALELARVAAFNGHQSLMEGIFPELKESENERIRQKFIKLVQMSSEVGGFALHKWEADEMLAWLEKQGEQKPIDWSKHIKYNPNAPSIIEEKPTWSEEDEVNLNRLILYLARKDNLICEIKTKYINWIKSIKQRIKKETV